MAWGHNVGEGQGGRGTDLGAVLTTRQLLRVGEEGGALIDQDKPSFEDLIVLTESSLRDHVED